MNTSRADWKRLRVGDEVSGFDACMHGKFTGIITRYERVEPVRKNLPIMVFATVSVNEFGSTVVQNFSALDQAYDETRPLIHREISELPLRR